jgi:hypothetical protein
MEDKTFRQKNAEKAREARRQKITAEKLAVARREVDEIADSVTIEVERAVAEKVRKISENIKDTQDKIKLDFLKVFYEMGGVKGLIGWVKSDLKNRKEYYKLLIGLIKTETQVMGTSGGQRVVLNIIAPKGEQTVEVIDGEQVRD